MTSGRSDDTCFEQIPFSASIHFSLDEFEFRDLKAIASNGVPQKVVIDKSGANLAGGQAVRSGSVCLNSFGRFVKWTSASLMPPPSLVSAR
ncbi:hypothetical protein [Brucella pseudogrignonensis]|uniref:Uncharacterized protein n=1 Tax=Brucella pseudogrignonensis TaxID=419475 RepID=A0ABU1MFE6_9HYPH|nr:hypothetical protein [Brucella pseudogrignonensis]MDR6434726.1 hypothetical protein [Brucella pseudogrignonensis]